MEIIDKSEKLIKDLFEEERLSKIEVLAKTFFSSCIVSRNPSSLIYIESSNRGKVAVLSTWDHNPGKMELYSKDYEEKAINFGNEYEKEGLNISFKDKLEPFRLEKHYI